MKWLNAIFSIGKIKDYISLVFVIIVKARNILEFVEDELGDSSVAKYIPKVRVAIDKVSEAVAKVLGFLGVPVHAEVVSLSKDNVNLEVAEMDSAVAKLKKLNN